MRAHDVAQLLPTIFLLQHKPFVRTVAKGGRQRSWSVGYITLTALWKYLVCNFFLPRSTFFCHLGTTKILGSERVAKISLFAM